MMGHALMKRLEGLATRDSAPPFGDRPSVGRFELMGKSVRGRTLPMGGEANLIEPRKDLRLATERFLDRFHGRRGTPGRRAPDAGRLALEGGRTLGEPGRLAFAEGGEYRIEYGDAVAFPRRLGVSRKPDLHGDRGSLGRWSIRNKNCDSGEIGIIANKALRSVADGAVYNDGGDWAHSGRGAITMVTPTHPTLVAPASVTNHQGRTFQASVSQFLPNSLLLKALPEPLGFRERITVELFGFTVLGEVVFAGGDEAAVMFETSPEVFEAIEVYEDYLNASMTDAPAIDPPEPKEDDWTEDPTIFNDPLDVPDLDLDVVDIEEVADISGDGFNEVRAYDESEDARSAGPATERAVPVLDMPEATASNRSGANGRASVRAADLASAVDAAPPPADPTRSAQTRRTAPQASSAAPVKDDRAASFRAHRAAKVQADATTSARNGRASSVRANRPASILADRPPSKLSDRPASGVADRPRSILSDRPGLDAPIPPAPGVAPGLAPQHENEASTVAAPVSKVPITEPASVIDGPARGVSSPLGADVPPAPHDDVDEPASSDDDMFGEALAAAAAASQLPAATIDLEPGFAGWDALPTVSAEGRVSVKDDVDTLAMLLSLHAERPLLVSAPQAISRAELEVDGVIVELVAIPVGGQAYVLHPPVEAEGLENVIRALRPTFDAICPPEPTGAKPTGAEPDPEDLPVLKDNGRVCFSSHAQFLAQLTLNLLNGAVMARGGPVPTGTPMPVVLVIPEVDDLDIGHTEVAFSSDGKVGFSVGDVEAFKSRLERRRVPGAKSTGPITRRQSSVSRKANQPPPFDYRCALRSLPDARTVIALRAGNSDDLASGHGWYIALLDRVLRSGRDALFVVRDAKEKVKIWVHDGRVVAAERRPPPDKDRLGERLVASRALDSTALEKALAQGQKSNRPVGQVILSTGNVTRAAVHRELRKQIMDRVVAPCDWQEGTIEVSGWSDPPVNADLLPVKGDAVITTLLRKQLQQTRLADLREELGPLLEHRANVDLSKLYESYRLNEREQRFYQRGADAQGTLATLVSLVRSRPLEGYRLMMIGAALGFITITRT